MVRPEALESTVAFDSGCRKAPKRAGSSARSCSRRPLVDLSIFKVKAERRRSSGVGGGAHSSRLGGAGHLSLGASGTPFGDWLKLT